MTEALPSRDELRQLCERAAQAIMKVRDQARFEVRVKADASPVTQADLAANQVLLAGLEALAPDIPVISEEQAGIAWETRREWRRYWLIDPLDGTSEFINGNDDFTVNLALVEAHRPVLGVVCAPVTMTTWLGGAGAGAWRHDRQGWQPIRVEPRWPPRVLVSRLHRDDLTQQWAARLPGGHCLPCGSSLKFCRIAEGEGDLYPRFAPTSEWDTAAAQAVLEGAGGGVLDARELVPLQYNRKASFINPSFIACALPDGPWRTMHAGFGIGPHG